MLVKGCPPRDQPTRRARSHAPPPGGDARARRAQRGRAGLRGPAPQLAQRRLGPPRAAARSFAEFGIRRVARIFGRAPTLTIAANADVDTPTIQEN